MLRFWESEVLGERDRVVASVVEAIDGRSRRATMSPSRSKPAFEPPADETGRAVNQAPRSLPDL